MKPDDPEDELDAEDVAEESETDPEDRLAWPTVDDAVKLTGKSKRSLKRLENAGKLEPYLVDGLKRYDPAELAALTAPATSPSSSAETEPSMRLTEAMLQTVGTLLGQLTAGLRQTHRHNEEILKLVLEPQAALNRCYVEQMGQMRQRIEGLEKHQVETFELAERLHTQQWKRELEAKREEFELQRWNQGFEILCAQIPNLFRHLSGAFGGDMVKLIQSLTPEQLGALKQAEGFLSAEQLELLQKLCETEGQGAAAGAAPSDTNGTNGAGAANGTNGAHEVT